jgi:hypothetical protein
MKFLSRQKATIEEQIRNNITKAPYENHNRHRPWTG